MARGRANQTDEQIFKALRARAFGLDTTGVATKFRYPMTLSNREVLAILNRIDPQKEKKTDEDSAKDLGPVGPSGERQRK